MGTNDCIVDIKKKLEKEAEELIQRFEIANSMNNFLQLTPDRKQIGEMLVMFAEPREKRIAELEEANKANEWHYVKDGDLPKHENYVLVSNGKDWTKGFYKDKIWNIISLVGFWRIIAWKEIELPKE